MKTTATRDVARLCLAKKIFHSSKLKLLNGT